MVESALKNRPGYFYAKAIEGGGCENIGHSKEQLVSQLDVWLELTDDEYAALLERLRSGD